MSRNMTLTAAEFSLLWEAVAAFAENSEDMEGLDGADPKKIVAARALADRFDAQVAASAE
jgi:hypothetical protein